MKSIKEEIFIRQLGIVDIEALADLNITIIGAGGIGTPTAIALAKMGCENITVYDGDTIEEHNIPNQMHLLDEIGNPKVVGLEKVVESFTGVKITGIDAMYQSNFPLTEIVIAATDSMKSRKEIFEGFMNSEDTKYLIDGRMAGEYQNVYFVEKKDLETIDKYTATIVNDKDAEEMKCTEKAIIYNVFGIAAVISSMVKRIVSAQKNPFKFVWDYRAWWFETIEKENYIPVKPKGEPYVKRES